MASAVIPETTCGAPTRAPSPRRADGIWKLKSVHMFNTFTADYAGGWTKAPGRRVPGPSTANPPDRPPTVKFEMFPKVYEIPYHYRNPVTGQ